MIHTLDDLAGHSKPWVQLLDALMPGGKNWHRFLKDDTCKTTCPAWDLCTGSGPGGFVCSVHWRRAEANPLVLDVLRHVLENYNYYDRGDCTLPRKHKAAESLLVATNHEALRSAVEEFAEGNVLLRLHRYRERNIEAVRDKKQKALASGHLYCEGCGVDYLNRFDEHEALRVMECHHTVPLSSIRFRGSTKASELVLLCANCHRLAHSQDPPLPVSRIRAMHGRQQVV